MKKTFLYCGTMYPDDIDPELTVLFGNEYYSASNIFYTALISGLVKNDCDIYFISYVSSKILGELKDKYQGKYNVVFKRKCIFPFFQHVRTFVDTLLLARRLKAKKGEKEVCLITNVLRISNALGGIVASRLFRTVNIGIVTDVPGYRMKSIVNKNLTSKIIDKIGCCLIKFYSGYVLLSEQMTNVIPIQDKRYIIIEGIFQDQGSYYERIEDREDMIIMYAGSLHYQYGIMNLVNAVIKLEKSYKLYIYGRGEASAEISELGERYENIKNGGFLSHQAVLEKEKKAGILINPRPVDDEYVKYSFPSKIMEYMASGTPTILTDIPSLPVDYRNYVTIVETNSVHDILNGIKSITESKEKYKCALEKANMARQYILSNKNDKVQAKKLIDFSNMLKKEMFD